MSGFTVLKYSKIQFLGTWLRTSIPGTPVAIYTADDANASKLLVITQSPAVTEMTYTFLVDPKQQVWVNYDENIVQIPGTWSLWKPGDTTLV